jgi:hypothetical protein
VDFAIKTDLHLRALQFAVREDGVSAEQLDAALGRGPEIQKLISERNPYRLVTFETDWQHLMQTMTYDHPRWEEFARRLEESLGMADPNWTTVACTGDMSKVTAVLTEMGMDVEKSLGFFKAPGLFKAPGCDCDCDVLRVQATRTPHRRRRAGPARRAGFQWR